MIEDEPMTEDTMLLFLLAISKAVEMHGWRLRIPEVLDGRLGVYTGEALPTYLTVLGDDDTVILELDRQFLNQGVPKIACETSDPIWKERLANWIVHTLQELGVGVGPEGPA